MKLRVIFSEQVTIESDEWDLHNHDFESIKREIQQDFEIVGLIFNDRNDIEDNWVDVELVED